MRKRDDDDDDDEDNPGNSIQSKCYQNTERCTAPDVTREAYHLREREL